MSYIFAICGASLSIFFWYLQIYKDNEDYTHNVSMNQSYDYIIVGAGSAGAIIATRLSEDPDVSVLVIEAGGSDINNANVHDPEKAALLMLSDVDWAYYTVPQKFSQLAMNEQKAYWPSGKVLGGSSSINFMNFARGSKYDYDQWAADGCDGWSYQDVLPYFKKLEDTSIHEFSTSSFRGLGGNIPISDNRYQNPAGLFTKAAKELEWETVDYNGKDSLGFSYVQYNEKGGKRYSSITGYLRQAMNRLNLNVLMHAFATKIVINEKRATGIEFIKDNRKTTVNARKEVIISAGGIQSPALLMLSGIGPRKHLEQLDIPVHADLPVGENFQNHIFFPLDYSINETLSVCQDGLFSSVVNGFKTFFKLGHDTCHVASVQYIGKVVDKNDHSLSPDYQITVLAVPGDVSMLNTGMFFNVKSEISKKLQIQAGQREFTVLNALLRPKSRGTIRLQSSDPFDSPLIDPNFFHNSDDVRTLVRAIRQSQKLATTHALRALGITVKDRRVNGICDKETFDSDAYWECHIRHFALPMWHPSSTCRMGARDDKTSVVDPDLRVKGIQGLRVADCSVLRNIPSGNTNGPCMMVGEKAADIIKKKDIKRHHT